MFSCNTGHFECFLIESLGIIVRLYSKDHADLSNVFPVLIKIYWLPTLLNLNTLLRKDLSFFGLLDLVRLSTFDLLLPPGIIGLFSC